MKDHSFRGIPNFISSAMAMFPKYLDSSLGSQRHPLVAVAALCPPFPRIILLKLSRLSTNIDIADNDMPTGYPEAENTCPIS